MSVPVPSRIVNASPIIYLSHLGLLDTLKLGASRVILPVTVEAEVRCRGEDDPASRALDQAAWMIRTEAPIAATKLLGDRGLDPGESAVVAIALQILEPEVVLDDRLARREAARLGLRVAGTLGILIRAKHAGLIEAVSPLLQRLLGVGMYLSARVVEQVLRDADEPDF